MTGSLQQGPLYFFDQPKIKKEWDKIMVLGEQLADLNSHSSNSQESGCLHRNCGCTEGHMERNDTLIKNNTAKKDPSFPLMYDPSVFGTIHENLFAQLSLKSSDTLTEEVLLLTLLEEYKGMALTMLCELEETLNHFSKNKFVLPQGILNILPCTWEELTEDACRVKKTGQRPAYKNIKSERWQTSEHNRLSPASECKDCEMAEGIKRQHRRKAEFPTRVTKGAKKPETLLNRLSGNKTVVSEQVACDLPVAISFSLSSKLPEKRGEVFQHSDSNCSKGLEWNGPCVEALERLHPATIQIAEQQSKEARVDKPVIFRHYADVRNERVPKNIKGRSCKAASSVLPNDKLKLPVIKQLGPALTKLHYELADGSSFIYYPSGHSAVCQSSSNLPCGGMYTNIFSDVPDQALIGTFTPFGHGSVCFPNSNNIAMIFNQEGGMVTNKGGEILREWKWPGVGKLDNPVIVQVNKYITVRIAGRLAISLVYRWQHECVRLSLQLTSSHLMDGKPLVTKTPRVPEKDLSHIKDFGATRELRKLRRKIKNILENWLEYYWTAFGFSSPQLHKSFPLQEGRLCKTQPPVVFPHLQTRQRKKCSDNETPDIVHPSHFQFAAACSLRQDENGSSRAPHLLNNIIRANQPFVRHTNKDKPISQIFSKESEKPCCPSCTSCPAALRRTMLGGEGKLCSCSNHQIPYVTDLEYNHIINSSVSSPEQITVICITSSLRVTDYDPSSDEDLESLYERKNRNRSMPCIQSHLDSFRLLRYDINSADEFTDHCGSLLVKRHNVAPGMFLMYIQGRLLFANYIFNGYSRSAKDLQKQIALTRCDYSRGYYLPTDYRFRMSSRQPSAGQALPLYASSCYENSPLVSSVAGYCHAKNSPFCWIAAGAERTYLNH